MKVFAQQPNPIDRIKDIKLAFQRGDILSALRSAQDFVRDNPPVAGLWFELAKVIRFLNDDDLALVAAKRALKDAPDDPARRAWVADLKADTGDISGAIKAASKLAEDFPDVGEAEHALGLYNLRVGNFEAAEDHFRTVIQRDPLAAAAW